MFSEINAGIANHDGPEEDKEGEEGWVDGVFGTGTAGGALESDGRLMAAQAEVGGQGKDVGSMG